MDSVEQELAVFKTILEEFSSIPMPVNKTNIFKVAGYPHYENVSSNILAFYLNPKNEHGLKNLVLYSLLSLVDKYCDISDQEVEVYTEETTFNKGRIDLVVITDLNVIGIENKIYHYLANDLEDYGKSVEHWAEERALEPLKIVLSLNEEACTDGFVNITYAQLFASIRKEIGRFISPASQKWLFYLVDFMDSIENLMDRKIEFNEMDQFIIKNKESVEQLQSAMNDLNNKFSAMVRELKSVFPKPDACNDQWIYAQHCLVHDYVINDHPIAFDLYITERGWELEVHERHQEPSEYLEGLFRKSGLEKLGISSLKRSVIAKFSLTESYSVIVNKTSEVMEKLIQSAD